MLLNDSVELDHYDYSASAEPLPMNWDIDLPKIWIPSSLLPNRKKQINPNENKPFVLYTLEKLDYSNTFSVYADECLQYHESQTLSAVPSKNSQKLMNNNIDKLHIPQVLPSSQNTVEWDGRLDIENKKEISPRHPVIKNKLSDSLRNSQQTYDSMIRNAAQCEKKTSDTYSVQEARCKASLDNLAHRMAEILSEDEPFKENWHHEDIIKTNQVTTSSTLDSIPPSIKDSLEELYFSDENRFAIEEYNLEIESPEKEHTNNYYIQEPPSESFANNLSFLELAKIGNDKTVHQSVGETEDIPREDRKVVADNAFNQTEKGDRNEIDSVFHTKNFEQELQNSEEESEDTTAKVVDFFPFAYKRPPLQENINKIKIQKEKKKTKKAKINILLEDLFQIEEADRFKIPEVDEFYENLVRQGKCKPRDQGTNMDGFPFASLPEKQQTNSLEFPSENLPAKSHLFWDSAQKFIQCLSSEPHSNSPDEIRKEEKVEPQHESNVSLDILVIDNIPLNVSKENIESFILGYAELKNLTIERRGKFQRAKLQMDFICDVDWIIDCLNNSQPFGSFDTELIKCYRQT